MRVLPILAGVFAITAAVMTGPVAAVAAVTANGSEEMLPVRDGGFHGNGFHDFHGGGFRGEGHGFHHGDRFDHGFAYGYGFLPGYAYQCPYPTYAYPYCVYR
jgi:hypothetical protein